MDAPQAARNAKRWSPKWWGQAACETSWAFPQEGYFDHMTILRILGTPKRVQPFFRKPHRCPPHSRQDIMSNLERMYLSMRAAPAAKRAKTETSASLQMLSPTPPEICPFYVPSCPLETPKPPPPPKKKRPALSPFQKGERAEQFQELERGSRSLCRGSGLLNKSSLEASEARFRYLFYVDFLASAPWP